MTYKHHLMFRYISVYSTPMEFVLNHYSTALNMVIISYRSGILLNNIIYMVLCIVNKGLVFYNNNKINYNKYCCMFNILASSNLNIIYFPRMEEPLLTHTLKIILCDWRANLKCQLFLCKCICSFSHFKRGWAQMATHKSCDARQSSRPDNKTLYNVMMVSACLSSFTLVDARNDSNALL